MPRTWADGVKKCLEHVLERIASSRETTRSAWRIGRHSHRRVEPCQARHDGTEITEGACEPIEIAVGPGDSFDVFDAVETPIGETSLRLVRADHQPRQVARREVGEEREPRAVVDREVVGPGMELDREVERGVGSEERGKKVGHWQQARPDRPRLPGIPTRRPREHAILDVRPQNRRREPFDRPHRVIEPHQEVARVKQDPGGLRIKAIEQPKQFIHRKIRVRLDREAKLPLAKDRRDASEDVYRRVDLLGPGRVGPKSIVPITHVNPGKPASRLAATASICGINTRA